MDSCGVGGTNNFLDHRLSINQVVMIHGKTLANLGTPNQFVSITTHNPSTINDGNQGIQITFRPDLDLRQSSNNTHTLGSGDTLYKTLTLSSGGTL